MPLTTLPVRDVRRATPRTRMLRLDTGASGFTYAAGQAVMAGLHGSPLRKPYSIASAPVEAERNGFIELLVQSEESAPGHRAERSAAKRAGSRKDDGHRRRNGAHRASRRTVGS